MQKTPVTHDRTGTLRQKTESLKEMARQLVKDSQRIRARSEQLAENFEALSMESSRAKRD